jgi:membrane protease YdiL (CAAX protease family)
MAEKRLPRAAWVALAATGAYNLIQNLAVPTWAYIPANLTAAAGLVAIGHKGGATIDEMGLRPKDARSGLRLGLAVAAGTAAAIGVAIAVPATRDLFIDQRVIGHQGAQIAYRALLRFPLGTALFEEVAFRGVLFALFARRLSTFGAATAAAAAFGAWHFIPSYQALQGSPISDLISGTSGRLAAVLGGSLITALSSYPLTFLRIRSKSLVAPWIAHAAFNSLGYLAGILVVRSS